MFKVWPTKKNTANINTCNIISVEIYFDDIEQYLKKIKARNKNPTTKYVNLLAEKATFSYQNKKIFWKRIRFDVSFLNKITIYKEIKNW